MKPYFFSTSYAVARVVSVEADPSTQLSLWIPRVTETSRSVSHSLVLLCKAEVYLRAASLDVSVLLVQNMVL